MRGKEVGSNPELSQWSPRLSTASDTVPESRSHLPYTPTPSMESTVSKELVSHFPSK